MLEKAASDYSCSGLNWTQENDTSSSLQVTDNVKKINNYPRYMPAPTGCISASQIE